MIQSSPDILEHIRQKLPNYQLEGTAEPLVGGYLNLTWRVPAKPRNIIGKWIPPYIASQPDFFLPPERAEFESRALKWLEVHQWDGLRMPILLDFDEKENVILMEDMGKGQNLSAWMLETEEGEEAFVHCGRKLGEFIGKMHATSWGDEALKSRFNNYKIQEVREKVEYQLDFSFFDPPIQDLIGHQQLLTDAVLSPGKCLTMGDFWPKSILLGEDQVPAIIDWELVHFGHPFQDYAHMWAHLWMHAQVSTPARKQKITTMISTFTHTYKSHLGVYREEVFGKESGKLLSYHVGSEILQRSMGHFVGGYLYEEAERAVVDKAIEFGRRCLEVGDLEWM